ncbi:hypothetical protein [Shimia sp. FJ5]|uniref:hypothetical protein n=1 Tax=Shimia sp. FJ5 TaxID=3079054 RepID=UPI002629EE7B|nr:hypothetical protein [Shimia sp. FJ5]MDV4143813.1 hypothetical protein [Shimia sp. FJ5]
MTRFMIPIAALTLLASQAGAASAIDNGGPAYPETPRDLIFVTSVEGQTGDMERLEKDGYVSGEDGVYLRDGLLIVETFDEMSKIDVDAKPRLK